MIQEKEMQELVDNGYTDGKRSFEICAKEIFESFNFENIHKAMTATNWCWHLGVDENGQENQGIPTIETIKRHALILLKKSYDEEKQISTGGFTCGIDDGELYLVFTLEENSTNMHSKTEDY